MYWLIFGVTMLLSFGASAYLKSVYARCSRIAVASGLTGAQAAARILSSSGIRDVDIVEGQSFLGDHYDPLAKKLVLSPENYEGSSAANVGVAAHECGHALQHQQHYFPLQLRMSSVYLTNFASQAIFPIMLASVFLHIINIHTGLWLIASCFGILMLFQLITLPVEYDASARAKVVLQQTGIIQSGQEASAVNSTLNAAGLTYVAALIGSILQFLYWFMLANNGRRN